MAKSVLNSVVCLLTFLVTLPVYPRGAYLFAHMKDADYGALYYSVSLDGKKWITLNGYERIDSEYFGHPNIVKGGDGVYYMIAVSRKPVGRLHTPILYSSRDLITWEKRYLDRTAFDKVSEIGYQNENGFIGAPKLFYDKASGLFIITWHAFRPGTKDDDLWESMRTFYMLTSDFLSFTFPARLFNFTGKDSQMATIDATIVEHRGIYYAIIKDERWPRTSPTGKTIRIAQAKHLTGPYSNPGPPVTPAWREAPTVVPRLKGSGWNIYAEEYPQRYNLFQAPSLSSDTWMPAEIDAPERGRHGCVIKISKKQYKHLLKAFP